MSAISVVIPARNAELTLGATLEGLARQDVGEPFEVIVVDDGSTDGTVAIAEAGPVAVNVLRRRGLGPGPARNEGVAAASGAIVAFTDADCVPTPGWLRAGSAALAEADLVQGAVQPDPVACPLPFDRTVWVTREGGLYECASLFVRRALFERLGGFEDWLGAKLGKQLAEDTWFGWRARRAGARTAFCAEALVHHAVFRRGLREFAAERVRCVYFPAIARQMPELRRHLLFGRIFLNSRTAAFDLAVAAAVTAAALGSRPVLLGAVPWAVMWLGALRWRRYALHALAGGVTADAVSFAALATGSVRSRSLVI